MEEYDYDIEYVKGKENKVADCLSRISPITSDISKQAMWEAGISDEEDGTAESTEDMTPEKLNMHTEFIN